MFSTHMVHTVTPWEVKGTIDYERLMKEFGLKPMPQLPASFTSHVLFRRGIIYGHRDFDKILHAIKTKKPFVMITGLMPSGKFHFGHKMVADQMILYQKLGARVYICVADLEAYNTRNQDTAQLREIAIQEYLLNYLALGLDISKCDFYFQSTRSNNGHKASAYYRLANMFSRHATFNEFQAVYGEITPAKMASSLLQASDMTHAQLPEFEGPLPIVIPVGIDQDPHVRLARDMITRLKAFPLEQISSTYHTFMPGLSGGKMSSSDETSYIALTDTPEDAARKIKKYAFSGGQATLEEHRRLGGNPDIDISFQMLKYGLEPDDNKLQQIYNDYKSGKLLSGELKQIVIEKITTFLKDHQEKRKKAAKNIEKFLKEHKI